MRTSRPMTAAIGSVSVPARAQSPRVLARIALMVLAVAGERGLAAPVLLARARAAAATLHHSVASRAAIERAAHQPGL